MFKSSHFIGEDTLGLREGRQLAPGLLMGGSGVRFGAGHVPSGSWGMALGRLCLQEPLPSEDWGGRGVVLSLPSPLPGFPGNAPELVGDCARVQLTPPPPSLPSLPTDRQPRMFRERASFERGLCPAVGRGQVLGVLLPPYAPLLERASPSDDKVPLLWLFSAAFQGRDSALFQLCGSCICQFIYPSIHLANVY